MFKNEIVKKDGFIYFKGKYLEMYVPKEFVERGLAEDVGNLYSVFGIIHLRTFATGDKPNQIETLKRMYQKAKDKPAKILSKKQQR